MIASLKLLYEEGKEYNSVWFSSSILISILPKSLIIEEISATWDFIGIHSCMQWRKRRCFRINDSPTTSSNSGLKSFPQWWCCFLHRKLIRHFVRQAKLNSHQGFLIHLLPSFFLYVLRLFSLPSSAFFNPLWVRMTFILFCHYWNWWRHRTSEYRTWSQTSSS